MTQMLMKLKNSVPAEKKKGVVYEIPCQDCAQVYVGKTGWTLKKHISEHKQAVKRFDDKNEIAVHVFKHDHSIAWMKPLSQLWRPPTRDGESKNPSTSEPRKK